MIREIQIENYKSVQKLKLNIGRITVLIGENGSGKSNILEAIALSSAAAGNKLDNEFLASRGIRVTEPHLMRAAFDKENITKRIIIFFKGDNEAFFNFLLENDNTPYSKWVNISTAPITFNKKLDDIGKRVTELEIRLRELDDIVNKPKEYQIEKEKISQKFEKVKELEKNDPWIKVLFGLLKEFIIFSPENLTLHKFEELGQIQPLGIYGEGLFKLLKVLSLDENKEKFNEIKEKIRLTGWFRDFQIPQNLFEGERQIRIKDRYLDENLTFDQKSSNEGFMFLLFYFALFISDDTPRFFAIDNIDASLNPKLCRQLIKELVKLAEKYDRQVIFTTHNPAVLDGLNLDDDEQRLFVVSRNKLGYTETKRILKPKPLDGQKPVKMSEAFLRGYIGDHKCKLRA
ncbi:ATP-binding protein [Desulfobacterales bacterium HSG2]|nr:ATP-binding protein [Desulfobacterales bacterium HSG2]